MRIAIFGCGAMGTVLGAYLTKAGYEIDMIDAYHEHVEVLNSKGVHITGSVNMTIPVKALRPEEMTGEYDLIFLLTKQTVNATVLPLLRKYLSAEGVVCTLQNGVPEPLVAGYIGQQKTVGGSVLWGATFIEPGVSELTQDITKADYLFDVGEIDGTISERIKTIAGILKAMGTVHISDKLMTSRWSKLINNACMSGMSAVCGCTFGEVLENKKAKACLSYLAREVKQCCEADGFKLNDTIGLHQSDILALETQAEFNESQLMFTEVYDGLRPAKASMLQDLEKNKITEVDLINGHVCRAGRVHNIATPFNDKVVELVHKMEQGELSRTMDNLKYFDDTWFCYS